MTKYKGIESPAYVLDETLLINNLKLIKSVKDEADISIILALKGFAMWSVFPLVSEYLDGATASSLHEAMLIHEKMGKKAHTYCAAYVPRDFEAIMGVSAYMSFNSLSEYERYKPYVTSSSDVSFGIRVNPGYSDVGTDLYNPCTPGSRLGVPYDHFDGELPDGIEGLHFHALCENDSYSLERVLLSFEDKFGRLIHQAKWVNMGGGHLMTRVGYDTKHLIQLLRDFKTKYNVDIILEPGSAIAWQTGDLLSTVLDVVDNQGVKTAMLDVSFTAHMPDTLEMPYKPLVEGADLEPKPGQHVYRLGGMSCLSGDYMSEYGFDQPLNPGDHIVLKDMMHYTMVKTTTFNGVQHPSIAIMRKNGDIDVIRTFGYEDYKNRLS